MAYRSNLPTVRRRIHAARRNALIAAAETLVAALKEAHLGGHTSGAFVTGNEVSKITRLEPEETEGGAMLIRVTTLQTDPPYPWFWVTGHQNIFTGRFERDDRWTPTAATAAAPVAAAYKAEFARGMAD